jgi:hypothetical protein
LVKFRGLLLFLVGVAVGTVVPAAAQIPPSPVENQLVIRSDGFIFLIRDGMRHLVSPIAMSEEEINALLEGEPYLNGLVPVEALSAVVAQPVGFVPQVADSTFTPTPTATRTPTPIGGTATPTPTSTSTTSDDLSKVALEVPSSVSRGSKMTVRANNVPGGAKCQGTVDYKGDQEKDLDEKDEKSGRCEWEFTVASSVTKGDAEIEVEVTKGSATKKVDAKVEVK